MLTNMELTNILAGTSSPLEKNSSKKHQKRKVSEEAWKSSKHKTGNDDLIETSSSDSTSRSTPLSQETVSEVATPNSGLGFHSDLDFHHIDPIELIESTTDKTATEFDNDDLGDVEDILTNNTRYNFFDMFL